MFSPSHHLPSSPLEKSSCFSCLCCWQQKYKRNGRKIASAEVKRETCYMYGQTDCSIRRVTDIYEEDANNKLASPITISANTLCN
ncbi:uncharacterized protein LOC103636316 [Zea mays]|uniref:Uncharacterized protein n=1 Tax=Zea mays TaxID=4577 RepID=B4FH64_MAIZE|nr:uncharacterized protein LOC103636316 [Zea mays]ACF81457.1 unknown [Zea mays]|eukprot:NP_001313363.1 uncharacterized protein LOC103636316 [Zea mays]